MNNWKCSICSMVVEGETPPEVCPYCGTPEEQFIPTEEHPSTPTPRAV